MDGDSVSDLPVRKYPWITDLESTLSSSEGTAALESYLVVCKLKPLLEFIWACVGMKSMGQDQPERGRQLVLCIFENYIINGVIPILSSEAVDNIGRRLHKQFERPEVCDIPKKAKKSTKDGLVSEQELIDITVFDDARVEAEAYLRETLFPCFQKSVATNMLHVPAGSYWVKVENGKTPWSVASAISSLSSRSLASNPEAFVRAICEKLESLSMSDTS